MSRSGAAIAVGAIAGCSAIAACSFRDLAYLTDEPAGTVAEGGLDVTNESGGGDGSAARTPTVLADRQLAPRLLVQDTTALYWITGDGAIMTIAKENPSSPRAVAEIGLGATFLAADPGDGGRLFYSLGTQVFELAKEGGAPTPVGSTDPRPSAIALDEGNVYVAASDFDSDATPALYRIARGGGGGAVKFLDRPDAIEILALSVDRDSVFWDEGDNQFLSVSKEIGPDGGAPKIYAATGEDIESAIGPLAFAVDESSFFYSNGFDVKSLHRVDRSVATLLIPFDPDTVDTVVSIAIDATDVYAVDAVVDGTLRRNAKDGRGSPETLLDGLSKPNAVVVDDRWIFLSVEGPEGQILRLDK